MHRRANGHALGARAAAMGAPAGADDLVGARRDGIDPVEAARRLFTGECFAISDHTQVGNPVVYASPELADLTRYPAAEFEGRNIGFLMRNDTDQAGDLALREAFAAGKTATVVVRTYRADGTLFWTEQRHYPVAADGAEPTHVVSVLTDVSAQVHAAAAQDLSRELSASLDGDGRSFYYALLLDDDGGSRVAWVSESWRSLTGYDTSDVLDSGFERFIHPDDRGTLSSRHAGLREQERRTDQFRVVTQGGNVIWLEDFGARRWRSAEAGVTAVYGVATDVTHAKRGSTEMWRLSHVDSLTGLPNHYLLEDRVHQAQLGARRNRDHVALALLDLDHFRFINQTFSRRQGDRLILDLSKRLRRVLRRTDTLARWGGDSFALVLADLPHEHAVLPALQKVINAVVEPFEDDTLTLTLAASIGVDMYPSGSRSAAAMIERASDALRRAKETNRGSYRFYDDEFDAAMRSRLGLETELRTALAAEQLILHYQPRIELDSGAIKSVEALVRWVHPTRGLLKPAEFLPLLEESQLGHALFEWVLERACKQAKRWQRQRTPRRVAVNISPQALERGDLAATVKAALARHDLHPGLLEIEVSERTALATLEASVMRLAEMREMGVHVALDDFGIAQSSLTHLRELPLDGLKIDRSFVTKLDAKAPGADVDLLRAIIALGKSLKLRITAEGIETREQNSLLRSLRCDDGQGFLFSQPVPPEYVPAFA